MSECVWPSLLNDVFYLLITKHIQLFQLEKMSQSGNSGSKKCKRFFPLLTYTKNKYTLSNIFSKSTNILNIKGFWNFLCHRWVKDVIFCQTLKRRNNLIFTFAISIMSVILNYTSFGMPIGSNITMTKSNWTSLEAIIT